MVLSIFITICIVSIVAIAAAAFSIIADQPEGAIAAALMYAAFMTGMILVAINLR